MRKSTRYGIIGTTVFAILVLLLFLLVKLPSMQNSFNEPVYINLGDAPDGVGVSEPSPAMSAPVKVKLKATTAAPSSHENVETQIANSPVSMPDVKKTNKNSVVKQENIDKKKAQKLTDEAFQRTQQAKKAAEQQDIINRAQKLGSIFGKDQGAGSGNTQGSGVQGNPLGTVGGSANGINASVAGRSSLYIPSPTYQSNDEGTVTVHVVVDRDGSVSNAYIGASTTTSEILRNAALEAARKSKFSKGNNDAIGTIVYHFVLK
jgi:TonB family protein